MPTRSFSRREFLAGAGVLLVATACGSGGGSKIEPAHPAAGSIDALLQGAQRLELLSSDTPVKPGKIHFAFDLLTAKGGVVTGGAPKVLVALDTTTKALGPFPSGWFPFTAYGPTGDQSPHTQLPGTYATEIDVPSTGNWHVAVGAGGSQKAAWTGTLSVTGGPVPAAIGTKAISVPTPVAASEAGLKRICTRQPPDHLHAISLDKALGSGKPTVVSFATPLLCESQLCGPVVDEQIVASQRVGLGKANFIHVEEFLPGPDLKPPAPTAENASPAFRAWKFQTEPWVIVIDKQGIIRSRFEGPVVASQIQGAVQSLL